MEENIVLPQKVTIQLVDSSGTAIELSNVIFTIQLFARHKNNFYLGPFSSDDSGKVVISQTDLENEVKATYSSGLMDYAPVETCHPIVEIFPMQPEDIERALNARENVWTILLDGEKDRWGTLQNLLTVYRQAKNNEIKISKDLSLIRDEWNGKKDEYIYSFTINNK